ncbi:MAG: DUF3135 domain-containing protein [Gammaproteobacteria bacterium]|jgi:hypothetical protein
MASENPSGHDFDYWATLARRDPESFETERACVIETAIRQASPQNQPRLRCLQWKLDQIRRLSSTPMVASLLMNRMLWQAVAGRHGLVERLNYLQTPQNLEQLPGNSAEILPFPD